MLKIKNCTGKGFGSCRGCKKKDVPDQTYKSLLYKVKGLPGLYCEKCLKEILINALKDEEHD